MYLDIPVCSIQIEHDCTPPCFSHHFCLAKRDILVLLFLCHPHLTKGNNLSDFLFAFLEHVAPKKESTLKGKNLLQEEQILSFKSRPP